MLLNILKEEARTVSAQGDKEGGIESFRREKWEIVIQEWKGNGVCTYRALADSRKVHLRSLVMSLMWDQAAH